MDETTSNAIKTKIRMEGVEIPSVMRSIRKWSRWFAVCWFLIGLVVLVPGVAGVIKNPGAADSYDFLLALVAIAAGGAVFWRAPDWLIERYRRHLTEAANDPDAEIHMKTAGTDSTEISHVEIRHRDRTAPAEPFLEEDALGRVVLDSTQRPLRRLFGGAFLAVGLVIGLVIYFASGDMGFFEYAWVVGWCTFALISMGFVYETEIVRHRGKVERTVGWFFLVRRDRYALQDFDRVVVGSGFQRSRYDSVRERYDSEEPRFKVDLAGARRVNLRVCSSLADARRLASELSGYLKLPVAEETVVR